MNTLGQLSIGERARIVAVAGSDETAIRLLEMGLTPGIEVTLIGTALWGDPLEFEARGYRISLRKAEADRIEIASP